MAKRWQKTELAYLERNAGTHSIEELAQRFNTDPTTVESKIRELGLGSAGPGSDPSIGDYESGLKSMFGGNFKKAIASFEKVIAKTESRQVRALAQQHVRACHARMEGDGPSTDDPYLSAVFEKNRGDFEAALAAIKGKGKGDERFLFLAASIHALNGNEDEAVSLLEKAIDLEPKNRVRAFNDPDFADLRGTESFDALVKTA